MTRNLSLVPSRECAVPLRITEFQPVASRVAAAASRPQASQAWDVRAVEFRAWDVPTLRTRLDDVIAVYRAAFLDVYERDPDRAAAERRAHARTHLDRPGIRAVAALIPAQDAAARRGVGATQDAPPHAEEPATAARSRDELIGFAYGHPGRDGQWWHDVVTRSVPPAVARTWFSDCFEVVELHVLPEWQGQDMGRTLLRMLLSEADEDTAALSALADPRTRARRLYDSERFRPLHERFRFPGSPTEYAILVKRLRPPSAREAADVAPAATRF